MSKHTPGPWRVGDAGFTVFGPKNGTPCPEIIATIKNRKNARLIASAPEMVDLISEFVEYYGGDDSGSLDWDVLDSFYRQFLAIHENLIS